MPFYKWIIETQQNSGLKEVGFYEVNDGKTCDVNAVANKRMVNVLRHLSQLVKIATDIFGNIDAECVSVLQRTNQLKIKIKSCQDIVDNLNAKTVPVPVSTLSGTQESPPIFVSSHVDETLPIFCTFPRPPEVDQLRQLASGPSPPAFIPSSEIADGKPTTHIYCQPLPIQNFSSSGNMTSSSKVPSSVVPIDVSGQPFSRMSSFRRSLIHVDFFIRRKKKKEKRRNTVTEGESKELKEVFHNIINEKSQFAVMPNLMPKKKNSNHESDGHSKEGENKIKKISVKEKNNSSGNNTCVISNSRNCKTPNTISGEKHIINTSKNESAKLDLKNYCNSEVTKSSTFTKKKPKSNIPISTVSAAMNVAVEMRQLNGKNKSEDQSSSGNWSYSSEHNSSGSEDRTCSENIKDVMASEMNGHDHLLYNDKVYRNRSREKSTSLGIPNTKLKKENKEIETSSCTFSDNNGIHDDVTSNSTSTESDVFFISSDESDADSSDILFETNYGSSISLSTVSNGSLNSILSQTGAEMASSTGTLTSIGLERLPTPPPPPPPAIIAATPKEERMKDKDKNSLYKDHSIQKEKLSQIQNKAAKSSKKQKILKPVKTENIDVLKNSVESSKNLFTSLVNIKPQKEQNKYKRPENRLNKMQNQPLFNMYGNNSPQNSKQLPSFIKENVSPVMENEPKNHMQSFSSYQSKQECRIQYEKNPNIAKLEPQTHPDSKTPHTVYTNASDVCSSDKIEVPLKYVHKVTVIPIQRQSLSGRNNALEKCKKTLFKEDNQQPIIGYNNDLKPSTKSKTFYTPDTNSEVFQLYERPKPKRPMTLQPETKAAARVLLDPEGRVVHCTNSLDRKLYYAVPSERYTNKGNISIVNSKSQGEVIRNENKMYASYGNQSHTLQPHSNTACPTYAFHQLHNNDSLTNRRHVDIANLPCTRHEPNIPEIVEPNPNVDIVSQNKEIHPYTFTGNKNYFQKTETGVTPMHILSYDTQSIPRQIFQTPRKIPVVIPPNPNISGLPSNETMLTQHNVNLHSKQMEKLSMTQEESSMAYSTDSPYMSSQRSPGSPLSTEANKSQQSTMSTEDLFAVIHNCKKRMNIKSDCDISLASSSRSSSPSFLRPNFSKGALAETGFLSPRNLSSFDSGDRRSWADFRPTSDTTSKRKSLASDRLGPTKPTSMHDFKMLLLQTRSNSQVQGPRKSAVEMLRIPTSQGKASKINSVPLSLSSRNSVSYSVPNSPSSECYLYNGHSTVPFKRNNRARSTLQSRYTMYPPIFEDCSEDTENARDILQNSSTSTVTNTEVNKNTQLHHIVNNSLRDNTKHNLRNWI